MSRRPMLGKTRPAYCYRRYRFAVASIAAVTSVLIGAAAFADQQLEEIVVTAQKRSENVQKVPIAITAFTGETIQSKGLNNLHALSNLTPNVNLDGGAPFSGDSSVLSASIRGIGQDDFAFNLDPGVGVYLDGVYLARTIGANQNLLDVDRIEILKGPQGTLFGRNTIGGAINIVTHTPGTESKISGSTSTLGSRNRTTTFCCRPAHADFRRHPPADDGQRVLADPRRLSKDGAVSGRFHYRQHAVSGLFTDGLPEGAGALSPTPPAAVRTCRRCASKCSGMHRIKWM